MTVMADAQLPETVLTGDLNHDLLE
jgi:hypothetical protein